jgi:hypothetical protein
MKNWLSKYENGGNIPKGYHIMPDGTLMKDSGMYQNGGEMKYYQKGLDWKPRNISRNGSVVKDDMGYWNPDNWGKPVEIGSNNISMQGVGQPLIGVSDFGDTKIMYPGEDYKFNGNKVTEYPIAQDGNIIQKALEYHPIVGGAKRLMSNFAENANVFDYDQPVGRVAKNAILNQKSLRRLEDENAIENFQENSPKLQDISGVEYERTQERIDLLQILANKKQKYNSILPAEYRPSNEKNKKSQYYKSPSTEKQLQDYVDKNWIRKNIISKEDLPKMRSPALGNMKLDYGTDKQGNYISYYDKWDLNPVPQTGVQWLDKTIDNVVTGIPNALGITNTPEVYGRVYLPEKKNGGDLKRLTNFTKNNKPSGWLSKYE